MDPRHCREVSDPKEQAEALARTKLDIQLAAYEPDEHVFLAAHGNADSWLVARHTGEVMVWQVVAGTKEERKALAEKIRVALTNISPPK